MNHKELEKQLEELEEFLEGYFSTLKLIDSRWQILSYGIDENNIFRFGLKIDEHDLSRSNAKGPICITTVMMKQRSIIRMVDGEHFGASKAIEMVGKELFKQQFNCSIKCNRFSIGGYEIVVKSQIEDLKNILIFMINTLEKIIEKEPSLLKRRFY